MIIQLSVDIEINEEKYGDEDIKKIIDSIKTTEYSVLGYDITASWQNYKKYEYNDQSWE